MTKRTKALTGLLVLFLLVGAMYLSLKRERGAAHLGERGDESPAPNTLFGSANQVSTAPLIPRQTTDGHERRENVAPTPLQKILSDALTATTPEKRELAAQLSLMCVTLNTNSSLAQPDQKAEPNGQAARLADEQRQAHEKLSRYCASAPEAVNFIDTLHNQNVKIMGATTKSVVLGPNNGRAQEYFQAMTLTLGNPSQNSEAFDYWLSHDVDAQLVGKYGFSQAQSAYVQDTLYSQFVTADSDTNLDEIRQDERCVISAICPTNTALAGDDLLQAQRVAQELQNNIQQQRWNLLITQHR